MCTNCIHTLSFLRHVSTHHTRHHQGIFATVIITQVVLFVNEQQINKLLSLHDPPVCNYCYKHGRRWEESVAMYFKFLTPVIACDVLDIHSER